MAVIPAFPRTLTDRETRHYTEVERCRICIIHNPTERDRVLNVQGFVPLIHCVLIPPSRLASPDTCPEQA